VLTEDGVDVAASNNMVLRKLLVSAQVNFLYLSNWHKLVLILLMLMTSVYQDISILGKLCWRLALIVVRKAM
jgi:hypothetical protein